MEGDILSVSDVIKQAIAESEKQQKEVAAHMGWTPQNFANRLKNNTVDADEWVEIANFLGYDVQMVERKNGELLKERRKGVGVPVTQMVGGVIYDTNKSDAICHTNEFVGSFFELYEDSEGRKFIVLYANWFEAGIVMPVSEPDAQKFMADCLYKAGL